MEVRYLGPPTQLCPVFTWKYISDWVQWKQPKTISRSFLFIVSSTVDHLLIFLPLHTWLRRKLNKFKGWVHVKVDALRAHSHICAHLMVRLHWYKNRTGLSIYFGETITNGGHIEGTTWGVQWRHKNENKNFLLKVDERIMLTGYELNDKASPLFLLMSL